MKLDLALLHAPSVYDFRKKDDVLFAYLANSDSVHVSGIFEMPPVGLLAIHQYLESKGKKVEFYNIASHMLRYSEFDVEKFLFELEADFIGIDLHWLAHTQGVLELAKICKSYHKDSKIFIGGISASQLHLDAITYPQIDYVVRGADTLEYVEMLLNAENDPDRLKQVPNLTWKYQGEVIANDLEYPNKPYSAVIDWGKIFGNGNENITPYNIVIPQYGCEYNCNWCGGSQYSNQKEFGLSKVVEKTPQMLQQELTTLINSDTKKHTVTMINYWHEHDGLLDAVDEAFRNDKIERIHISIRKLPEVERIMKLSWSKKIIIELSPDSEQMELCKMCGHAHYTMEEMEDFIDNVLEAVYSFEIYFMIGIPNQTRESIQKTMNYCVHLLDKYRGKRVMPYICPMLPFLDMNSVFFDHSKRFGYKVYHKTLKDYCNALLSMNWKNRLNYETNCLSRSDLVDITYEIIREFTKKKAEYQILPKGICDGIVKLIDETVALLEEIDLYENMTESYEKECKGNKVRSAIFEYNQRAFKSVKSQQRPMDFGFARSQWFDTDEAFKRFEDERRGENIC